MALINKSSSSSSSLAPPSKSIPSSISSLETGSTHRPPLKPVTDNFDTKPASTSSKQHDYGAHKYNDWERPSSSAQPDNNGPSTASTVERGAPFSSRPVSAINGGGYGKAGGATRGDTTPTKQLAKAIGALDLHSNDAFKAGDADAAAVGGGGGGSSSNLPPNDGEDQQALYQMYQNIKSNVAPSLIGRASATSAELPLPSVWVSRWVDYSKKYGLGYKLSNGCSGVFFNDATKMLLETDGDSLGYIERMRRDDGTKYDVRKANRLSSYPQDLTKKVTLMEHFKNYLDETHPNRDSPVHVPPHGSSREAGDGKGVYVRKWMRTRHSIIFRLSNNNFQVNFFDDTEVVLWAEKRWVTYKGKNKVRATYELGEIGSVPELTKRIKYVTDILSQLVSRV